jgi:hypothetical protein
VTVDLFAGLPVSDYQRAVTWYERLLGSEPAFFPNATEAVWDLAEHRYLYVAVLDSRRSPQPRSTHGNHPPQPDD